MLRLYDRRAGQVTPVGPARRGELRTWTAGPGGGPVQPDHLRCYLTADLIHRIAERRGLTVTAWHSDPGTRADALAADLAALNIRPAQAAAGPAALAGPLDLAISGPAAEQDPPPAGIADRWVASAPVRPAGGALTRTGAGAGSGQVTAALGDRELEPLALRLALLQQHYRVPASPGWDALAAAGRLLRQWRMQVAEWAQSPSKPMCARCSAEVAAALDDDLDVPAALRLLTELAADGEIPPGSKFETFAYQDRVLGLDLASEIGR